MPSGTFQSPAPARSYLRRFCSFVFIFVFVFVFAFVPALIFICFVSFCFRARFRFRFSARLYLVLILVFFSSLLGLAYRANLFRIWLYCFVRICIGSN